MSVRAALAATGPKDTPAAPPTRAAPATAPAPRRMDRRDIALIVAPLSIFSDKLMAISSVKTGGSDGKGAVGGMGDVPPTAASNTAQEANALTSRSPTEAVPLCSNTRSLVVLT